jgi:hypothetical protein
LKKSAEFPRTDPIRARAPDPRSAATCIRAEYTNEQFQRVLARTSDDAIAALRKALELSPDDPEIRSALEGLQKPFSSRIRGRFVATDGT